MKKASLLKNLVLFLLFLCHLPLHAHDMKEALDARQRSLVIIPVLTATGGVEQLAPQLHAAPDAGLTINEIKAASTQLNAFCGFPRSLNRISQFMAVQEERKSRGVGDVEGRTIAVNAGLNVFADTTRANEMKELLSLPLSPIANSGMMVRMAEIEINPADLEAYLQILKEEAAASVKLEPGVIAIFPMFQKDQPNQIRILEIYASAAAYQAHLQTPHFLHYKTSTLKMVKSLKLVEMSALDSETMSVIFGKLQ